MPNPSRTLLVAFVLVAAASAQQGAEHPELPRMPSWPGWRGPLATGVAPDADPPIEWSEEKNIRWKVAIPGAGHSTPIVWGDHVFLTAAIPYGEAVEPVPDDAPGAHDNALVTRRQNFAVIAIDRRTGKTLWLRSVRKGLPPMGAHKTATLASQSPVTDGERVFAFFGSNGLYCLDFDGKLLWQLDLGDMRPKHGHGEGSSPVLHAGVLVIPWDHEGDSFVVALDAKTGKQRWRMARDEPSSWSSPIVVEHAGKAQVILAGTKRVRAYDLRTGEVVWECGGMSHNIVASPVAGQGLVVLASSYEKRVMLAIRLAGAKGDITGSKNVVWTRKRGTPYVPSPLLYGRWLYFLGHYQGVLSRVDVETGKAPSGPFRLPLYDIYASPVGAGGRVYVTDRDGTTVVLSHVEGKDVELLAKNTLEDRFSASAAVVGKALFLRGEKFLYCVQRAK